MKHSLIALATICFFSACAQSSGPGTPSLGSERRATSRLPAASNIQGNTLMNNYRMNPPTSPNQ